jgi:hypothetical protein
MFIWLIDLNLQIYRKIKKKNEIIDNKKIFFSFLEAYKYRKELLIKNDKSFDWKLIKSIEFKNKIISKYVKSYEYNTLQYEYKFTGIKFNLGIIVFNQKTNEFYFKIIEKKYFKKLCKIFPVLKKQKIYIENLKNKIQNFNNILDLKSFLIDFTNSNIFFNIKNNNFLEYSDINQKKKSIKKITNKMYKSYILDIFKKEK